MKLLFTTLFSCISVFCFCQTPVVEWEKSYGGSAFDGSNEYTAGSVVICHTSDGASILAAETKSNNGNVKGNHGDKDIWIAKLNKKGKIAWQKCFGGSSIDYPKNIRQTYDGGYVLIGTTASTNGDVSGLHGLLQDAWVVKIDSVGNILWQKCLGGSKTDYGAGIQQTADSGYIVACETMSNDGDVTGFFHGESDCWIVKLDKDGMIQWQKLLGGGKPDTPNAIEITYDGGYIIAAATGSNDGDVKGNHGGFYDAWVVRLDSAGAIQWQKCLGGTLWDEGRSIKQTADSGYIVGCFTVSINGDALGNHGDEDYLIVKLDKSGNITWEKCFGGLNKESLFDIQVNDNGYVVTGTSNYADKDVTNNYGNYDYWTVKIDSIGNLIWQINNGGENEDIAFSLSYSKDDGYLIAGRSNSKTREITGNHGDYDVWVVKLKEENILPVTLLSFTTQKQNNTALLKWQTTNEINNSYFSIERSLDSKAFSSIGKVDGLNITTISNYSFTDNAPLKGINFYRLKQVDKDGKYIYSEIVSADFINSPSSFSVSPNPASGNIKITIPASNAISNISLYDIKGRKIMYEAIAANVVSKSFDVSRIAPGVYHLVLIQDGKFQTIKFIKK